LYFLSRVLISCSSLVFRSFSLAPSLHPSLSHSPTTWLPHSLARYLRSLPPAAIIGLSRTPDQASVPALPLACVASIRHRHSVCVVAATPACVPPLTYRHFQLVTGLLKTFPAPVAGTSLYLNNVSPSLPPTRVPPRSITRNISKARKIHCWPHQHPPAPCQSSPAGSTCQPACVLT
jgi:hypothetical protein